MSVVVNHRFADEVVPGLITNPAATGLGEDPLVKALRSAYTPIPVTGRDRLRSVNYRFFSRLNLPDRGGDYYVRESLGGYEKMATYECSVCGMAVNATCAKCDAPLENGSIKLEDGTEVQVSKCPNEHGMIKSPMCCGQDMTCSVS